MLVRLIELARKFVALAAVAALLLCLGTGCRAQTKKKIPPSRPIDINSASLEQLEQLPGIGPVFAHRILDYRKNTGPFRNVDELLAVKGIGEKRLEKIRKYVMVKNPTATPTRDNPLKQPDGLPGELSS